MDFLLDFDFEQMRGAFNLCAFAFTHRLHGHPLFDLPRLARLARFLEQRAGRRDVYNAVAGSGFAQAFAKNEGRGWEASRAIEEIEASKSWMILKRIEQDPEYGVIVQECLRELATAIPDLRPRHIKQAEGFVFVTSPGAITPYHIDPQWSFLAQIHGHKTYRIYDVQDPEVISNEEIEDYYCGETMAARYSPDKNRKAIAFALTPGDAVNQPLHAPHSAEVGEDYSVSFTVAVISDTWSWQGGTHRANRWLRKRGFTPAAVGENDFTDKFKSMAYNASVGLERGIGRHAKVTGRGTP